MGLFLWELFFLYPINHGERSKSIWRRGRGEVLCKKGS